MRVLIISGEVWQDGTNGGNVLSNIFDGTNYEFAQIYCNPGTPQNKLCKKYYQMTDSMAIKNVLKRKPMGKAFELDSETLENQNQVIEQKNKKFYSFFQKHRLEIFYAIKDAFWNLSKWKNDNLKKFIDDFNPDIIFAPCYGKVFLQKLTRFIANYTGKKVISYISDDAYTLKQFRFSPLYWLRRFALRRQLRKTFPYYSICYTMTESQKVELEKDLNANMKILRKSVSFETIEPKKTVNEPIRIIYAGGIYLNRWKTLSALSKEIKKINANGQVYRLDVYTNNEITKKINKNLNDGKNCFIHSAVSLEELSKLYSQSDIALHVEGFDIKNRLEVRMSFSTKIVDCLSSGCAVMAICDKKQAGLNYLKNEDCAFCIDSKDKIYSVLDEISKEKDLIIKYSQKALDCLNKNHNRADNLKLITEDFENVLMG